MNEKEAIELFERFVESGRTERFSLVMGTHYGWCLKLKVHGVVISSMTVYFSPCPPGISWSGSEETIKISEEESQRLKKLVDEKGKSNLLFEDSLRFL